MVESFEECRDDEEGCGVSGTCWEDTFGQFDVYGSGKTAGYVYIPVLFRTECVPGEADGNTREGTIEWMCGTFSSCIFCR